MKSESKDEQTGRPGDRWRFREPNGMCCFPEKGFTVEENVENEHQRSRCECGKTFLLMPNLGCVATLISRATPLEAEPGAVEGVQSPQTLLPKQPRRKVAVAVKPGLCRHGALAERCPPCLAEMSPGIAARVFSPPRPAPWVSSVSEEECLGVDVRERSWRR